MFLITKSTRYQDKQYNIEYKNMFFYRDNFFILSPIFVFCNMMYSTIPNDNFTKHICSVKNLFFKNFKLY